MSVIVFLASDPISMNVHLPDKIFHGFRFVCGRSVHCVTGFCLKGFRVFFISDLAHATPSGRQRLAGRRRRLGQAIADQTRLVHRRLQGNLT